MNTVIRGVQKVILMVGTWAWLVILGAVPAVWLVVAIDYTWRNGFWPTFAEAHDEFFGKPDATETGERLITLEDCMAKAVAQQPLGRPINPLWDDLRSACAYQIASAKLGLIAQGKTSDDAWSEIRYLLHPIVERAQPIR
jgi:hypothetical protein